MLFFDENIGVGVPNALHAVGLPAHSAVSTGLRGASDERWLEVVGGNGWLALSCDKQMLQDVNERAALVSYHVGIVFFTNGEMPARDMLRVVLNQWDALEALDRGTPRPFARFLSPNGRLSTSFRGLRL